MKPKLFRLTTLFIAFTLLAVMFLGTAGSQVVAAPPAGQPAALTQAEAGGGIVLASSAPEWTATTKVWTEEEMLAAKPYPLPTLKGEPTFDISPTAPDGPRGLIPSALPAGAQGALVNAEPDFLEITSPLGYSYPPPFTRYTRYWMTQYPHVTIGTLFFDQLGQSWRCSAASIGNYAIWTAGHCIHAGNNSTGGWSTNIVFRPAYYFGVSPKGVWTAQNAGVLTAWYTFGDDPDFRYDYGFAILNLNGGQKISERVGSLGFAWNWPVEQHWFSIGYPAEAPFAGNYQVICASSYAYSDGSFGSPFPYAVGCDQTGGTSGGPRIWKFDYTAGANNYVNGHNDYRYVVPDHPLELFSPYYGTDAGNLRNYAVISCNPVCP